jgi:hypothetical protein
MHDVHSATRIESILGICSVSFLGYIGNGNLVLQRAVVTPLRRTVIGAARKVRDGAGAELTDLPKTDATS